MKQSNSLVAGLAALTLAAFATSASAASPGALAGAGAALQSEAATVAEPARYACWWNGHRRVCTWARPVPHYGLYWGPPRRHYYGGWGYGRGWGYGVRRHW